MQCRASPQGKPWDWPFPLARSGSGPPCSSRLMRS